MRGSCETAPVSVFPKCRAEPSFEAFAAALKRRAETGK
jgi:hypothetical protein